MHLISKKRVSAQKILLLVLLLAPMAACEPPATVEAAAVTAQPELSCGTDGELNASLLGGIHAEIDWSASELDCDSMLRPDDNGIRLRFSGDISGERLAIIIALPGLEAGQADVEVPSNVTATVEGSGRFFSTPDLDSCWTEILAQAPLGDYRGAYTIDGALYCITPLGEINGDAAVTIADLSFSTIVHWN